MSLSLQQQSRCGLLRHIEIALRASHPMLTLIKEVVGAVPMAQVIEFPRLGGGASTSYDILIDQNFDRSKVAGEIARIRVGLGNLQWSDLGVMLSSCWSRMTQPLLQLKERHRLARVVELRRDRGPGAVTGDVATHIGKRNAGLFAESWNEPLVEIAHSYPGQANKKEKVDHFASLRIGEFCSLWAYSFPGGDGFADNPIYGLGEGSGGLVDRNIEQTNGVGRQNVAGARHSDIILLPPSAAKA